jgi:hypothetical protein
MKVLARLRRSGAGFTPSKAATTFYLEAIPEQVRCGVPRPVLPRVASERGNRITSTACRPETAAIRVVLPNRPGTVATERCDANSPEAADDPSGGFFDVPLIGNIAATSMETS